MSDTGVGSLGNREIRRNREDSGRLGLGFQGGISSSTTKQNFSARFTLGNFRDVTDPNSGAHRSSSKNNLRWPQRREKSPPAPPATPLSLMALHCSTKRPTHELKISPPKLFFMEIRLKTAKTLKLIKPNPRSSQKQHSSSRPLK